MNIAVLTANLGSFDNTVMSEIQGLIDGVETIHFYEFNDSNFPPVAGLSPRLQYRIPKLFGWEMFPDYDIYVWLDGSMNLSRPDSVKWLLDQLGAADCAFFKHPWRNTIEEEVDHIEEYLEKKNEYIVSRYENGFHQEMYKETLKHPEFKDESLFASNVFIYRNNPITRQMLREWWFWQSRYYTCDQVCLPFVLAGSGCVYKKIEEDVFKCPYVGLVSKHK